MNALHSTCINGDVSRAERSDGCGKCIKSDEMRIDLAEIFESSGDRQAGGGRTAEAVNKHINSLFSFLVSFCQPLSGRSPDLRRNL